VQETLRRLGYYVRCEVADGVLSPETQSAIKIYKVKNNLTDLPSWPFIQR